VLGKISGPKREEVTRNCRKVHNEDLHNTYGSPNIIRVIKLRRMGWTGHIAHMKEIKNTYKISVGKPEMCLIFEDLSLRGPS
jgi:hypothetical protein